jgi:hypothetical protein
MNTLMSKESGAEQCASLNMREVVFSSSPTEFHNNPLRDQNHQAISIKLFIMNDMSRC